jgi:hypothetical protein
MACPYSRRLLVSSEKEGTPGIGVEGKVVLPRWLGLAQWCVPLLNSASPASGQQSIGQAHKIIEVYDALEMVSI